MDENQRKLARLKAEQRAQTARETQLRNLIDGNNSNLEDKLAVFKTLVRADQARFTIALSKMLEETDQDRRCADKNVTTKPGMLQMHWQHPAIKLRFSLWLANHVGALNITKKLPHSAELALESE